MRPFKFIVQAVLLVEDDGRIVGEQTAGPIVLYGDTLAAVAGEFDKQLSETLRSSQP